MRVLSLLLTAIGVIFMIVTGHGYHTEGEQTIRVIITAIIFISAFYARKAGRRCTQRELDQEARDIVEEVLAGKAKPHKFVLYLRPFLLDGSVSTDWHKSIVSLSPHQLFMYEDISIDELLRKKINLPIIKIGSITDELGAAIYKADDRRWFAVFQDLVRSASFIVIVPLATPSSTLELAYLKRSELLEKCLFLLPPVSIRQWMSKKSAMWVLYRQRMLWQYSMITFLSLGILLPMFKVPSLFFCSSDLGEFRWFVSDWRKKNLEKALRYFTAHDTLARATRNSIFGEVFEKLSVSDIHKRVIEDPVENVEARLSEMQAEIMSSIEQKSLAP